MDKKTEILTLLARTGAASSGQLQEWVGDGRSQIHHTLGDLECKQQLVAQVAKARFSKDGRPQTVWGLTMRGARQAGIYFSPKTGLNKLVQGLGKTSFVLTHRDGYYPSFLSDQVAMFEKHGSQWPWQKAGAPTHSGALIHLMESEKAAVHVILPLVNARDIAEFLLPDCIAWSQQSGYILTLLTTDKNAVRVHELLNAMENNWEDSYFQQRKTYTEWKACLRGLTPSKERYRHYILRLIKEVEKSGGQSSAERYDLIVRTCAKLQVMPNVITFGLESLHLLHTKTCSCGAADQS